MYVCLLNLAALPGKACQASSQILYELNTQIVLRLGSRLLRGYHLNGFIVGITDVKYFPKGNKDTDEIRCIITILLTTSFILDLKSR